MKRTIIQVAQVLLLLIAVLMIPLMIKSYRIGNSVQREPEILQQAAVSSGEVLGASTMRTQAEEVFGFPLPTIQKVALYTLVPLFMISVVSFTKFKVMKKSV